MAEGVIAFLLSFGLLNGELEFALNFPHEEVVDHNVVGRIVQFVLDSDQSEFALHALILIEKIDRLQQADEPTLGALQFRSHYIADSEWNEINALSLFVSPYMFSSKNQVMDENIEIT